MITAVQTTQKNTSGCNTCSLEVYLIQQATKMPQKEAELEHINI